MTTVRDIYQYLNDIAPFDTALSFDNCGILIGDPDAQAERCLLCLDVTKEVAEEARETGCSLILSHHPVIFQGMKRILKGSLPYLLVQSGLTVLSAHTNLDFAKEGVNFQLASACGLTALARIPAEPERQADGFGLVGRLEAPLSPQAFVLHVKEALQAKRIKYTDGGRPVQTVAVSCGSGAYLLEEVLAAGVDALVTAEVKHHQLLEAKAAGLTLIDAGHFETENLVIEPLCRRLSAQFPTVSFRCSAAAGNPADYL